MADTDVTALMTETLAMFVLSDQVRQQMDDYETLAGMAAEPNWSPEMRQAINLLADLRAGRIRCIEKEVEP